MDQSESNGDGQEGSDLGHFFKLFVSGVQNNVIIRHLDSEYILTIEETTGFPDELNVKCKRNRGIKISSYNLA